MYNECEQTRATAGVYSRTLTKQQEAELSEDTKAFLKAGFFHDNLELTSTAQIALCIYLFEQNRAAMVQIAKDRLSQATKN